MHTVPKPPVNPPQPRHRPPLPPANWDVIDAWIADQWLNAYARRLPQPLFP